MSPTIIQDNYQQLTCPRLPLAVYREIVAHLRQVDGVEAGLLDQTASAFDYWQSQVGGLWIKCPPQDDRQKQINSILNYYEAKYDSWQSIES